MLRDQDNGMIEVDLQDETYPRYSSSSATRERRAARPKAKQPGSAKKTIGKVFLLMSSLSSFVLSATSLFYPAVQFRFDAHDLYILPSLDCSNLESLGEVGSGGVFASIAQAVHEPAEAPALRAQAGPSRGSGESTLVSTRT